MDDFDIRVVPWAITLVWHNWPVMIYGTLTLGAALLATVRPSRRTVLLFDGLLLLTLAFEYQKHMVQPLVHTAGYIFERVPSALDLSKFVLTGVVGPVVYFVGSIMLVSAAYLAARRGRRS